MLPKNVLLKAAFQFGGWFSKHNPVTFNRVNKPSPKIDLTILASVQMKKRRGFFIKKTIKK